VKKVLKWVAIGFAGLIVSGAVAGCGSDKTEDKTNSTQVATSATSSQDTDVAETTTESAPPPAEPVSVVTDGPFETTHDQVKLHGTVTPKGSKVRINGVRASVKGGRWSKLVQITKKGDNDFKLIATKAGHDKDSTTTTITRKLSSAEKAAAQAAKRQAFIASAQNISYEQLLAHPSRYKGERAVYHGQIFQVQEDGGSTVILISVTDSGYGFWDDHVWVDYDGTIKGAADDMITVYGTLTGTESYDTQAGGNTTVPSMHARYVVE
jgi:hypothetical protein